MLPGATDPRGDREAARGRPSGRTQEIQRLIGRSLRAVADLTALGERTLWVDCDVLQADGGTRCASITGAYTALALAVERLLRRGDLKRNPLRDSVAAVSAGIVGGEVMLDLAGIDGGRDRLQMAIDSGKALQKFIDVTIAQGGDPSVIEDTSLLAVAEFEANIEAPSDGYVTSCDALTIGLGATHLLGSGRTQRLGGGWKWGLKQDAFDHGVGITVHAKIGDAVSRGDPLATIRYSDESLWEAHRKELATAWIIGEEKTSPRPLILETVTSDSLDL